MHPSIKILGLICFGVALNQLTLGALATALGLTALVAAYLQVGTWLYMLWRMRWLFLSMLFVYGLSTPGEYVQWMPIDWGVTYEGLRAAGLQITRLATMLGCIALLMATTPRNDLIAGFYLLLTPLKVAYLKPERFAARLYLTLQYLEDTQLVSEKNKRENFWTQLLNMNLRQPESHKAQVIALEAPAFSYIDFVCLAAFVVAGLIVWF